MSLPSATMCECCAKRGSVYMTGCRGCEARWAARAPKVVRQRAVYPAFKQQHGDAAFEAFKAEVRAEWERDKSQGRQ